MDLEELTEGRIVALWYCPPSEGRLAVLLIEPIGGPKTYRRVWLDHPAQSDDWTWHKPDDAILVIPPWQGEH